MTVQAGCKTIPDISYSAFAQRIGERISTDRTPLDGSLELTFRCNLRCAHCFVNAPRGDHRAKERELTAAEIRRITDEVVDRGCLWMLLTGGEPLLRPDLSDIYLHMKRRGLLVTLFTNGTTVTPRIADLLAEWPPLVVEVSIYGSSPEVYERMTGVPGSFRRCMHGIELLLGRKVRLRLKTVPTTLNYADMGGMRALAAGYGLDFEWDPLVNCRLDGAAKPAGVRLRPEQILALEQGDSTRAAAFRVEFERASRVDLRDDLITCGAYLHAFHIDPYGRLVPCMLLREPAYSLREGSFREGWDERFPRMRKRARTKAMTCDGCDVHSACDQCVGWALLETGDPEARVPFLCDLTALRAAAFGPASQARARIATAVDCSDHTVLRHL
jgi:radical SAM protein with 4Fe4S-binding SPASM domain